MIPTLIASLLMSPVWAQDDTTDAPDTETSTEETPTDEKPPRPTELPGPLEATKLQLVDP
ncbi:MAG: hypothetical protein GWP91_20555, partial [Rhodobacterales bacterium]|nr:hypothetical protein [Rhodobacterales bacterium]